MYKGFYKTLHKALYKALHKALYKALHKALLLGKKISARYCSRKLGSAKLAT